MAVGDEDYWQGVFWGFGWGMVRRSWRGRGRVGMDRVMGVREMVGIEGGVGRWAERFRRAWGRRGHCIVFVVC